MDLSEHIRDTITNLNSMIERVKEGELLSNEDAETLILLQEAVIKLRDKAILYDYNLRVSGKELSKKYNLSEGCISQIINGK